MSNRKKKSDALRYHSHPTPGKIAVVPTKKHATQRELSLAYSPGVAEPCLEIAKNQNDVYKYTSKGSIELGFDINNDPEFDSSNQVYKAMRKKIMKEGLGRTNHMDAISEEDLTKLYKGIGFSVNTPVGLQAKVWFEIVFYLCRRGRENQRDMTKAHYQVAKDASGREFVYQAIGEADKNHSGVSMRPEETTGESRMYSLPGNPACPVLSFRKYLSKLHPDLDCLWQRPLDMFVPDNACWYYRMPVSSNTLGDMMKTISNFAGLSQEYTNHCIRSTHITVLDENDFSVGQIMRSTGHKSESSIKSYASRLSDKKKRKISDALSTSVGLDVLVPKTVPTAALGAPPPVAALPAPVPFFPSAALGAPPPDPFANSLIQYPDAFDLENIEPFSVEDLDNIDAIVQDLQMTPISTTTNNTLDVNHGNRSFNFQPTMNGCNISFNFYGTGPRM